MDEQRFNMSMRKYLKDGAKRVATGQDTYIEIRSPTERNALGAIAVASITSLMS